MKKKNDFKQKNIPPEPDTQKEKRTAHLPVGDLQQEIREMRQAMINVRNLPFERHRPVPPEAIPESIEDLYQRLKKLETRLELLEQRVSANPYDPENMRKIFGRLYLIVGVILVFLLVLSGC